MVGIETDLEGSLALSAKVENEHSLWLTSFSLRYILEMHAQVYFKVYMWMSIIALFVIGNTGNSPSIHH